MENSPVPLLKLPSVKSSEEFSRTQLESALTTFRWQVETLQQLTTVLLLAVVTLIGFSISARSSAIMMLGAIFPIVLLYAITRTCKSILPVIYAALSTESRYGGLDEDRFASVYFGFLLRPEVISQIKALINLPDAQERLNRLRSMPSSATDGALGGRGLARPGLVLVALGQLAVALALLFFGGWNI